MRNRNLRWRITIEAWPRGAFDQAAAGERSSEYVVTAQDIRGALVHAEDIQEGIRRNPAVWEAPIMGIVRIPD